MTTATLLDFPTQTPTARELMERALDPHMLVGMPHLTPHGLSETWLMKELGHRHWLMLAGHLGMGDADFRTPEGREAYAAICATSLRDARLGLVKANDILTIRSTLSTVSRTQMSSSHSLCVGSMAIAEIVLLSTFVHRLMPGDNYSIARVALTSRPASPFCDSPLARTAAALRAARQCGQPEISHLKAVATRSFQTSPSQEFNGAGLFYFAEFQALMDRAFEQSFSDEATRPRISDRQVFFFGNVRDNERLEVRIYAAGPNANSHELRIFRSDGAMIAYATTSRAAGLE